MVAVLYSPGFGAGWYSWNQKHPELLFNPQIVQKVLDDKRNEITEEFVREAINLKDNNDELTYLYIAPEDLVVEWLPIGTRFIIHEYDGAESIKLADQEVIIA